MHLWQPFVARLMSHVTIVTQKHVAESELDGLGANVITAHRRHVVTCGLASTVCRQGVASVTECRTNMR